ncbi:MAG: tetratricopeptide repeat protein [Thermodesulfobacteriota bacterium]
MTYRKNERVKRICAGLLLIFVAVFILLATYQTQHRDSDIFWALRAGQWIVGHFKVPATDPFSYTFSGSEWVDFTWGFQVIAHVFFTFLGGWRGLFVLQLLLTGLTFAVLYRNLHTLSSKRGWLAASLLILVFADVFPRLFIRPHLFAYLFVSLYLLLLSLHEKRERPFFLFMLLPLQVLWVNIHSSAVLGVFIIWAYTSGEIIDGIIKGGFGYLRGIVASRRRLLIASALLPVVSLINPYGLKLVLFPFIHQAGANADALRHISEWMSLPIKDLFFSLYPFPVNLFAFRLIFYGGVISFFANYRRLRAREIIFFAVASYMAATHARWIGLFAFFAAPLIASNISRYLDEREGPSAGVEICALGAASLVLFLMIGVFSSRQFRVNVGLGVHGVNYPVGTTEFLKREKIGGNIYNSYVFGGYLIYNNQERGVFIDGRTPTVYSPYFFWTARRANSGGRWGRLAGEHGLTAALVKIEKPFCDALYSDNEWVPVVFDDVSVLYLKKNTLNRDMIEAMGLDMSPCSANRKVELPGDRTKLKKIEGELKKVITALEGDGKGTAFARPHRLLGLVETELGGPGDLEAAVGQFKASLSIKDDSYTNYDMGIALGKLKRRGSALKYFKASVAANKKFLKGYLAVGLTLFDMGEYEGSVKWLEKYTKLADDRAEYLGYKALGMACFKLSRLTCAERALKRAAFLTDDEEELSEEYYYLGNAFFEENEYAAGLAYYKKALEVKPEYAVVLKKLAAEFQKKGRVEDAKKVSSLFND